MPAPEFTTTNPDALEYRSGSLCITVLGGIRLQGLDRLRATLKVQLAEQVNPSIRHNLDLYNDTQLLRFTRKAAERLEVGTSIVSAVLAELIEALEAYRLEQLESAGKEEVKAKVLTKQERATAEQFLQSGKLLEKTITQEKKVNY